MANQSYWFCSQCAEMMQKSTDPTECIRCGYLKAGRESRRWIVGIDKAHKETNLAKDIKYVEMPVSDFRAGKFD